LVHPPPGIKTDSDLDPRFNKDAYNIIMGEGGDSTWNAVTPIDVAALHRSGKHFEASEVAVIDGTTIYLSTILPMDDQSPQPWTIIAYQMKRHRAGDLLCKLKTRKFIQDFIF